MLDLADPNFLADPYPAYRYLRERAPVWRSPLGMWVLSRHADIAAVLKDHRFGLVSRRIKAPAVIRQECDHCRRRGAFVSIDERMIHAQVKRVRGGHPRNILVKELPAKLLRGRGNSGFEQRAITDGRISALVLDCNGMERQDIIDREKSRR